MPRVEGSNPGHSFFSFMGTPRHASIARRNIYFSGDEMTEDRENAGAARRRRRTGRRFRNGYEKGFRFELAIRLNGERRLKIDMVRKY